MRSFCSVTDARVVPGDCRGVRIPQLRNTTCPPPEGRAELSSDPRRCGWTERGSRSLDAKVKTGVDTLGRPETGGVQNRPMVSGRLRADEPANVSRPEPPPDAVGPAASQA